MRLIFNKNVIDWIDWLTLCLKLGTLVQLDSAVLTVTASYCITTEKLDIQEVLLNCEHLCCCLGPRH